MTTIGYARVSTTDQDLDIQVAALKREGCTTIRSEKRSGTTTHGREELRTVLDFLRKGDVLMVTRIDRLARSIGDLQDIVRTLRAKGASLKVTEQPIDTSTATGKCFLDMLGVFAEFETTLRRERQLEGIAKAKAAGVYKGRPASIDAARVRELKGKGMGRFRDREDHGHWSGQRLQGAVRCRHDEPDGEALKSLLNFCADVMCRTRCQRQAEIA
jgi:DNA invertase Pin-like site-specific DNA recombinase